MAKADILTNPVVLALVGYAALVATLLVVTQPLRLRMIDVAEGMLAERRWNAAEREEINQLLDTSMSVKIGLMLPVAAIASIMFDVLRTRTEWPASIRRLEEDHRFHELSRMYIVSVLAANPLAGVFSIALMGFNVLILLLMQTATFRDAIEEPILKVSAAMAAQGRRLAA